MLSHHTAAEQERQRLETALQEQRIRTQQIQDDMARQHAHAQELELALQRGRQMWQEKTGQVEQQRDELVGSVLILSLR